MFEHQATYLSFFWRRSNCTFYLPFMNSSSLMWAQSSCMMYISHMEIPGQISRAVYRPKCITYPQKVLHVHGNWVLTQIWHANMSLISYVCKTKFMATDRASKWHNPSFSWNQETYEITCSYGKAYWRASQWVASFFLSFFLLFCVKSH